MGSPPFYAGLFLSSNLLRFPHIRPAHPRQSASNNSTLRSDQFGWRYPWFPFVLAPLSLCPQPHRDYLSNKVDNFDNILTKKQNNQMIKKVDKFYNILTKKQNNKIRKDIWQLPCAQRRSSGWPSPSWWSPPLRNPPVNISYQYNMNTSFPLFSQTCKKRRTVLISSPPCANYHSKRRFYSNLRNLNANSGVLRCFLVLILSRQKVG